MCLCDGERAKYRRCAATPSLVLKGRFVTSSASESLWCSGACTPAYRPILADWVGKKEEKNWHGLKSCVCHVHSVWWRHTSPYQPLKNKSRNGRNILPTFKLRDMTRGEITCVLMRACGHVTCCLGIFSSDPKHFDNRSLTKNMLRAPVHFFSLRCNKPPPIQVQHLQRGGCGGSAGSAGEVRDGVSGESCV